MILKKLRYIFTIFSCMTIQIIFSSDQQLKLKTSIQRQLSFHNPHPTQRKKFIVNILNSHIESRQSIMKNFHSFTYQHGNETYTFERKDQGWVWIHTQEHKDDDDEQSS